MSALSPPELHLKTGRHRALGRVSNCDPWTLLLRGLRLPASVFLFASFVIHSGARSLLSLTSAIVSLVSCLSGKRHRTFSYSHLLARGQQLPHPSLPQTFRIALFTTLALAVRRTLEHRNVDRISELAQS